MQLVTQCRICFHLFSSGNRLQRTQKTWNNINKKYVEERKRGKDTVPTYNPESSVPYCSLRKAYVTEEHDIPCGFECHDHFYLRYFFVNFL